MYDVNSEVIIDILVSGLEKGIPEKLVCNLAGVPFSHYLDFYTEGILHIEEGTKSPQAEFSEKINAAKASALTDLIDVIRNDAIVEGNVKSAQWLLERMAKDDYGNTTKHQHKVEGSIDLNSEILLKAVRELEASDSARVIENPNNKRIRQLNKNVGE